MGKKFEPESLTGTNHKMKSDRELEVLSYSHKEKTNHMYNIKFIDTKNEYLYNKNQILKGTCRDLIREKELKRLQVHKQIKERNKLVTKTKNEYSYPFLADKTVLGVDLATKTTGLCLYKNGIYKTKIVSSSDKMTYKRIFEVINKIELAITMNKVDVIVLEDIYLGLNSKILVMLAEIRGALAFVSEKHKVEIVLLNAKLWKCFFNLSTDREESKKQSMGQFRGYFGKDAITDDESDAFLICKFAVENGKVKIDNEEVE